jgi:hypothetical protein
MARSWRRSRARCERAGSLADRSRAGCGPHARPPPSAASDSHSVTDISRPVASRKSCPAMKPGTDCRSSRRDLARRSSSSCRSGASSKMATRATLMGSPRRGPTPSHIERNHKPIAYSLRVHASVAVAEPRTPPWTNWERPTDGRPHARLTQRCGSARVAAGQARSSSRAGAGATLAQTLACPRGCRSVKGLR